MATAPAFAATPQLGFASVSTANTGRDGTGTIVDAFTAGSNGAVIFRVVIKATDNPADSTVTMFIHDGTSYRIFDEFDIGDPAAGSTTVESYRAERAYSDLLLESGNKIAFAVTVAPTGGNINCFVHAGDL